MYNLYIRDILHDAFVDDIEEHDFLEAEVSFESVVVELEDSPLDVNISIDVIFVSVKEMVFIEWSCQHRL